MPLKVCTNCRASKDEREKTDKHDGSENQNRGQINEGAIQVKPSVQHQSANEHQKENIECSMQIHHLQHNVNEMYCR